VAHKIVDAASRQAIAQKKHLRTVLGQDLAITKYLSPADIDALFDPKKHTGVARKFVDRVLATHRQIEKK
jgi:3-carboxy-cis,cis-muconate cycloisomerase